MKSPKKSTLQKQTDPVWSKCVILIWGRCAMCGATRNLTAHHGIHRDNMTHRYRLDNGICLCAKCHTLGGCVTPHNSPELWALWLKLRYPKRSERIQLHKHDVLPRPGPTVEWYREQMVRLKAVLKRLEAR